MADALAAGHGPRLKRGASRYAAFFTVAVKRVEKNSCGWRENVDKM
jgi:hypothetical protein